MLPFIRKLQQKWEDVNENGKKALGLDWQNNTSARASSFFVHFFDMHWMTTVWKCLISYTVEDMNSKQRLWFSFPELCYTLLVFTSRKNSPHLMSWTRWNKRNEVWRRAFSLFKWHFCSRRLRCCLSYLFT